MQECNSVDAGLAVRLPEVVSLNEVILAETDGGWRVANVRTTLSMPSTLRHRKGAACPGQQWCVTKKCMSLLSGHHRIMEATVSGPRDDGFRRGLTPSGPSSESPAAWRKRRQAGDDLNRRPVL